LAANTHLAERQWLKVQMNVVKLCMFRVGTRRPTELFITTPQILQVIIIQFNSYLFMCKLNSTEANYKVTTGTEEEKIHIQRKSKKQGN
jgi:hypothetical protein